MIPERVKSFLLQEALGRFLRYVRIWTTSDESSSTTPSSKNQLELLKLLSEEAHNLNLKDVIQDQFGYLYATIPPSKGLENVLPIGFIAHVDTSPSVSGENVIPVIHEDYDGSEIEFPKNKNLTLTIKDSPQLQKYIGMDIITSNGDTLLGADDKAGIAAIMTACAAWKEFSELKHGPIVICFTPDEEISRGTDNIKKELLPNICYTVDGGEMGELEFECFDAWRANIEFIGINVHPGYAKNQMINAIHIASRFLSEIPEAESPEHTEGKEGFYHLNSLNGTAEQAQASMIIRDFDQENNSRRMNYLELLKKAYESRYPGLKIDLKFTHQYQNMYEFIKNEKNVIELAKKAIEMADVEVIIHSIRGGTDGSKLSEMGIPTPNIFTGGHLFHSRKEYIPKIALQKATEVIINLAYLRANIQER